MSPGRRQIGEHFADSVATRSVLARLVSVGRGIQESYDRALSPFGMTLDEYRVLAALRHAGSQGLDAQEFQEALREIGGDLERDARLEHQGWLERDTEGRRTISADGRQLIADLEPALEAVEDDLAELLGSEELVELARIVTKIVN